MMKQTTIHIAFTTIDGPAGGGNQFLMSLKKYLQSIKVYEENSKKADVILFNSHQHASQVAKIKLKCPDKLFVHRIDGPMQLYNKATDKRDSIVFTANKYLADATIFQSAWSREKNYHLGLNKKKAQATISNAPDPTIFNREGKSLFSTERKARLIATSWSSNWNKGFGVYKWLDEHLDFEKFEMIFIGNSPVKFKKIKHIPPLNSKNIAQKLKESDIFITASQKDPCSNSLIVGIIFYDLANIC